MARKAYEDRIFLNDALTRTTVTEALTYLDPAFPLLNADAQRSKVKVVADAWDADTGLVDIYDFVAAWLDAEPDPF